MPDRRSSLVLIPDRAVCSVGGLERVHRDDGAEGAAMFRGQAPAHERNPGEVVRVDQAERGPAVLQVIGIVQLEAIEHDLGVALGAAPHVHATRTVRGGDACDADSRSQRVAFGVGRRQEASPTDERNRFGPAPCRRRVGRPHDDLFPVTCRSDPGAHAVLAVGHHGPGLRLRLRGPLDDEQRSRGAGNRLQPVGRQQLVQHGPGVGRARLVEHDHRRPDQVRAEDDPQAGLLEPHERARQR